MDYQKLTNTKLWPSNIKVNQVEKSAWLSFLLVIFLYMIFVFVKVYEPGPDWKDLQIYSWSKSHNDYGLSYTKGYNLSLKEAPIFSEVYFGDYHKVYVGVPSLFSLVGAVFYKIFDGKLISARCPHVLFDLIMFYAMFVFAISIFKSTQRNYLLLFLCSPMVFLFSTHPDPNTAFLGLSILSYHCFINFLSTKKRKWLFSQAILFLLAYNVSYFAISILPGMVFQLWLNNSFNLSSKKIYTTIFFILFSFSIIQVLVYLSFLPNGIDWLFSRFKERLSADVYDSGNFRSSISIIDYFITQNIRILSYYTPISAILSCIAIATLIKKIFKKRSNVINSVTDPYFQLQILIVLFSFNLPFVFMINAGYIHPFSMYGFVPFFAFGSAIGIRFFSRFLGNRENFRKIEYSIIIIFLLLSISRSTFTINGGSLPHLLYYISPKIPYSEKPIKNNLNKNLIPYDKWVKYVGE